MQHHGDDVEHGDVVALRRPPTVVEGDGGGGHRSALVRGQGRSEFGERLNGVHREGGGLTG